MNKGIQYENLTLIALEAQGIKAWLNEAGQAVPCNEGSDIYANIKGTIKGYQIKSDGCTIGNPLHLQIDSKNLVVSAITLLEKDISDEFIVWYKDRMFFFTRYDFYNYLNNNSDCLRYEKSRDTIRIRIGLKDLWNIEKYSYKEWVV